MVLRAEGLDVATIADRLGRSEGAITSHVGKLKNAFKEEPIVAEIVKTEAANPSKRSARSRATNKNNGARTVSAVGSTHNYM